MKLFTTTDDDDGRRTHGRRLDGYTISSPCEPNGSGELKNRLPSQIDFNKCREEIAVTLNVFSKRWCRREHVECNALNSWKISIFNIIEKRISFYSKNLNLLPPKPKLSFRHLKQGIQQFHERFVLAPADKASNNAIVV